MKTKSKNIELKNSLNEDIRCNMENLYLQEIRLSRELARAIEQELNQYGKVIPSSVHAAYLRLVDHYERERKMELQ